MEPRHEMLNWQVFTDGAASPDGRGGWAYVVVKDDVEIRREQGSALGVTHQRMEIRAVAEALLAFPRDVPVEVIGDSAYAIDCFVKEWHVRWEQNGWRNSSGKPVANRDEWERVLAALRARSAGTTWDRVPGHGKGKHPWNDLADALAVEAKGSLPRRTSSPRPTKQEKRGLYLLHIDGGNKASAAGEMGEGAIGAVLKEPNGTAIPGA
jgi:ribonuclease HI